MRKKFYLYDYIEENDNHVRELLTVRFNEIKEKLKIIKNYLDHIRQQFLTYDDKILSAFFTKYNTYELELNNLESSFDINKNYSNLVNLEANVNKLLNDVTTFLQIVRVDNVDIRITNESKDRLEKSIKNVNNIISSIDVKIQHVLVLSANLVRFYNNRHNISDNDLLRNNSEISNLKKDVDKIKQGLNEIEQNLKDNNYNPKYENQLHHYTNELIDIENKIDNYQQLAHEYQFDVMNKDVQERIDLLKNASLKKRLWGNLTLRNVSGGAGFIVLLVLIYYMYSLWNSSSKEHNKKTGAYDHFSPINAFNVALRNTSEYKLLPQTEKTIIDNLLSSTEHQPIYKISLILRSELNRLHMSLQDQEEVFSSIKSGLVELVKAKEVGTLSQNAINQFIDHNQNNDLDKSNAITWLLKFGKFLSSNSGV